MSDADDILHFQLDENCFLDSCLDNDYMNTSITTLANMGHPGPQCSYGTAFSPGPTRSPKRRGRPIANNAARERTRVKTLRSAFLDLQRTLPAVPPDTKLSKLDVLVLATTYIAHLMSALADDADISQIFAANGCMHPVKKWPMRTRLYAGILSSTTPHSGNVSETSQQREVASVPWFIHNDGFKR